MTYSCINEFRRDIKISNPEDLVNKWIHTDCPHAFIDATAHTAFLQTIRKDWPDSELIQVAGTANWRFSLNPTKDFREFHKKSDVDVIVISRKYFNETWEELRSLHRKLWYSWPKEIRDSVSRIGQDVYCGFVTPKHIPDPASHIKYNFLTKCNSYSTASVGYRDVKLMFFKSNNDTIDYYTRGIRLAKRRA